MKKKILRMFPQGFSDTFTTFLGYAEMVNGTISADFEVDENANRYAADWFGDKEKAKHFKLFGVDDTQGLYGYWVYEGCHLNTAPIVFLASEGVGSTVLANTIEEFMSLLALGKRLLGLIESWEETTEIQDNTKNFIRWMKSELQMEPSPDGVAIVKSAKASHPDLDAWIKSLWCLS